MEWEIVTELNAVQFAFQKGLSGSPPELQCRGPQVQHEHTCVDSKCYTGS